MNAEDRKPKATTHWLAGALMFPLFYVLSLGPAARWCDGQPGVRSVVLWVYAPIGLLQFTPLKKPVERYVRWWKR